MTNNDQYGDDIARLLAVLVRLQVPTQADAIRELRRAGISRSRIATLLGTTPNTVNVTLARAKKG
ncbi:MAG: helix-turn-helix domain-containing protein [Acidimicrobiia bacterium]